MRGLTFQHLYPKTLPLVVFALLAGCSGKPSEQGATLSDEFWPTEAFSSEAGATKRVVIDSILAGALQGDASSAAFLSTFLGEDFAERTKSDGGTGTGITLAHWNPAEPNLDTNDWIEHWNRYLAEFDEVLELESHTWEVQLREARTGDQGLETKEALWILGRLEDGRLREDRLYLVFDLERIGEGEWRLAGIHSEDGRTSIGPGPYFHDVTAQILPPGYDQTGAQIYTDGGPVLADFDRDGDIDLFLPRLHAPAKLYANDGFGSFDDVTAAWGLGLNVLRESTNSGLFLDFDKDGNLDLVVGKKQQGLRLLRNEGTSFRDVTGEQTLGGEGEWESMAAADYDGDGLIDIYRTNYGLIDPDHQPESYVDAFDGRANVLLRNLGEGRFEDVTEAAGMGPNRERWSYAAAWADFDRDGDMDLYVANDYAPNSLYRNRGDGTFEEVAESLGARDSGNGMGVSWADVDGDLWLDLYISNMQSFAGNRITRLETFPGTAEQQRLYQRFAKGNSLLRNDAGKGFEDITQSSGAKPAFWAWGNLPFDYDADGDTDLFVSGGFYTGVSAKDT